MLCIAVSAVSAPQKGSIEDVRNKVRKINKYRFYTTRILNSEEFLEQNPDGGGTLTGYFKNGKLLKIVEWIGLSSCVNITEYYIDDNQVIFIYMQGKEFDTQPSSDIKTEVTAESRFYFGNHKIVKSTIKGATRCSGAFTDNIARIKLEEYLKYHRLLAGK